MNTDEPDRERVRAAQKMMTSANLQMRAANLLLGKADTQQAKMAARSAQNAARAAQERASAACDRAESSYDRASARQKPGTGHTATPAMPAMARPSTKARKPSASAGVWTRHTRAASPAARAIAMITK